MRKTFLCSANNIVKILLEPLAATFHAEPIATKSKRSNKIRLYEAKKKDFQNSI